MNFRDIKIRLNDVITASNSLVIPLFIIANNLGKIAPNNPTPIRHKIFKIITYFPFLLFF